MLGIDAAWTVAQPSGLALVEETEGGWRLRAAAASYAHFRDLGLGRGPGPGRPTGSLPDAGALLATCRALTGRSPDIVAVDMPLSRQPITGRRASDSAVSVKYGARKCATHSPSRERPGAISDGLRASFEACGYALWTAPASSGPAPVPPGLIEVYPHPALVELTGASERLPYKLSRIHRYWPRLEQRERRERMRAQWRRIVDALESRIEGVEELLPVIALGARGFALKAYEDTLDAIVCAWVGVCALEGSATAHGDAESAIWIPDPFKTATDIPEGTSASLT